MNSVDHQVYQQVSQELQQGEGIEWLGQPNPGKYAKGSAKIVLFAIPWTAFALFWMAGAAGSRCLISSRDLIFSLCSGCRFY